jgi:AcrR family transcriptional regulator|tara:strand:+ start:135 stop:794 length:660 start_codon:yes stop_codon:yes gene_type:complete
MEKREVKLRQVVGKRRKRKHVQRRGNIRREKLLRAAEELLNEIAIEKLSFREISSKAGVPEGSAYHFFANRYDLLSALSSEIAEQFGMGFLKLIPQEEISSWHDLVDIVSDRARSMYESNTAAAQIWLSGRTPAEVRLAERDGSNRVSNIIEGIFNSHFILPNLPKDVDVFFLYMEVSDVINSLSFIEYGRITDEMNEEVKRVGKGYLSTYLPSILERR